MSQTSKAKPLYQHYFKGGGEMGELTRSFNWAETSLGSPETWPQSLLTTISIVLNSRFPMFIWWGPDLIQFYNDAYRPSLGNEGKHPKALGQKGEDCWPEIWPVIKPLIDQVLSGGESTWSEDQLIPIYRNNALEDVYWTFSYSRITGEKGEAGGVLVICNETTEKIKSTKKLEETIQELAQSEARLRYMLADAPVAIALFTGRDLIVESANNKMLETWGKNSSVIGKPLHLALPELHGQPFLQLLDDVFTSGKPYYGSEVKAILEQNNKLEEVYSNFVYHPLKSLSGETTGIVLVANIVTEQVVARKKIEQAEEMLRFSIEAANVGTWFSDTKTHEFQTSARLKEIYGFHPDEEITYEDVASQIPGDYRAKVIAAIERAIATGGEYIMEHPLTGRHDQKERWVRAMGKCYRDSDENVSYFSGLMIDITEQKFDELRKNDFIGMVSHELKTPLTSLNAYVQMLYSKAKKSEDAFTTDALGKVNQQVKKMSIMINSFLNVSRLESGKIHLNKQDFNLDELVNDIIDETKVVSAHKMELVPCDSITVHADRDKIWSVISNLLSNAVKYSAPDKRIEIKCALIDGQAQISVKDEGVGIKPEAVEKLFERYYRVETQDNQHISGFGIGLYLSAEIIQRHHGKIWAESEPGRGSTFYFSLPLV
jgi:two-component system sensor histidine kinase VicK